MSAPEAKTAPTAPATGEDKPRGIQERVSRAALEAADEIEASSGRRSESFPVLKSFVRAADDSQEPAPLAKLVSRRAGVAIKLYLALIWRTASPPFTSQKTARGWATLLDLPSPDRTGAARIRAALNTLAGLNLIRLEHTNSSTPPTVALLSESGDGSEYSLPSTSYLSYKRSSPKELPDVSNPYLYLKFPTSLWLQGYMQTLSTPGLAMLLILLSERADRGSGTWFSTESFPQRYGISAPTRSKGTRELAELGLLITQRMPVSNGASPFFDVRRSRKRYRLTDQAADLGTPPGPFWRLGLE